MDTTEACRHAVEIARKAGFDLRHRSLKSEACYLALPGRGGLLRIAAHASKVSEIDGQPILARLTFLYASPREESRRCLSMTRDVLEAQTAAAIGRFMIASAELNPAPCSTPPPVEGPPV